MMQTNQPTPLCFYLRKIDEPFGYECTPFYSEALRRKIDSWVLKRSNITANKGRAMDHSIKLNIVLWISLAYPQVMDKKRYKTNVKTQLMMAILDDHAEESWGDASATADQGKKHFMKVKAVLEKMLQSHTWYQKFLNNLSLMIPGKYPPYTQAFLRMSAKILRKMEPVQRKRYLDLMAECMKNCALQSEWICEHQDLDMDTYLEHRFHNIYVQPCLALIGYTSNLKLSEEEFNLAQVQELLKLATYQVIYVNDLFSFFKEYKGTLKGFNHSIAIMINTQNMTVQQAADEMCNQIERYQNEFIAVKDQFYSSEMVISDDLRAFITGVEYWMAGNFRWSRLTSRYHGKKFKGIITSGMLEWHPDGTIYTPDNAMEDAIQ